MGTQLETFSWKAFQERRIAVHCATQECALDFLRQCVERGIGVPFSMAGGYWLGDETYYAYDHDYKAKNRVKCSGWLRREGYDIYTWQYPLNHFTKNEMKNGMIVELRNGEKFMWLDGHCINQKSVFGNIADNLCDRYNGFEDLDIMKVFVVKQPDAFEYIFNESHLQLIWSRTQ